MKALFVIFLLSFSFCFVCYADEVYLKVDWDETSEKAYSPNDCIGIGVDGEEPEDAEKAYKILDAYIKYFHGFRYGKPWAIDVFKSPSGAVREVISQDGKGYLIQDFFPTTLEKNTFTIEYTISVFNEKNFVLRIGGIKMPFFKGAVVVTPEKITFSERATMAPLKGPKAISWGSIKAGR